MRVHPKFVDNPILFGRDPETGLVNAQGTSSGIRLYRRTPEGIQSREESWPPFLWLTDTSFLQGLEQSRKPPEYEIEELSGEGEYRYLLTASTQNHLKRISKHVAKTSGLSAGHPRSPQLYISDPTQQYLLWTGKTMFKGMTLEDLERLQLHVWPESPEEPIQAVGLSDGKGWFELLSGSEEQILKRLVETIKTRDPDVIEGHQLFKFHLPRLHSRAKELGVELRLGRDDSKIHYRRSRMAVAEKNLDYNRWYVHGRDVVDSWLLAQLHDVSARELESYDLEELTSYFQLPNESQEVEQNTLSRVARLFEVLCYPYFLQAQLFAYRYEHVVLRGNATRIDTLFVREYLRQRQAIPLKSPAQNFAGGYTAQEYQGVAREVYHCDVASLYPSLILAFDLAPASDSLGIFKQTLLDLKNFRLEARELQREAEDSATERFYGGLQQTFKILINSFYGYLGFSQGHFADFERAAQVTAKGRELLRHMMSALKEKNCQILEVDTDGIYFTSGDRDREATLGLVEELNETLPDGVEVELDGYYPAMYCHKMKNYALLDQEGALTFRGSGLRSRALEPFLRNFVQAMIGDALVSANPNPQRILDEYRYQLETCQVPVEELCKRDTLSESPRTYLRKVNDGKRNRAAAYELALALERKVVAGESLRYFVTGDKASVTVYNHCALLEDYQSGALSTDSVNWKYYQKKLKDTFKKFAPNLTKA